MSPLNNKNKKESSMHQVKEEKIQPKIVEIDIPESYSDLLYIFKIEAFLAKFEDEAIAEKTKHLLPLYRLIDGLVHKHQDSYENNNFEKCEELLEKIFDLSILAVEYTKLYSTPPFKTLSLTIPAINQIKPRRKKSEEMEKYKTTLNDSLRCIVSYRTSRISQLIKNLGLSSPFPIALLHEEIESLVVKWEKFRRASDDDLSKIEYAKNIYDLINQLRNCTLPFMKGKITEEKLKDLEDSIWELEGLLYNGGDVDLDVNKRIKGINSLIRKLIGNSEKEEAGLIPEASAAWPVKGVPSCPSGDEILDSHSSAEYYVNKKDLSTGKIWLRNLVKKYKLWLRYNPTKNISIEDSESQTCRLISDYMHDLKISLYGRSPEEGELERLSRLDQFPLLNTARINELVSTLKELFSLPSPPEFMLLQRNEKFGILRILHQANELLVIIGILKNPEFFGLHVQFNELEESLIQLLSIDQSECDKSDAAAVIAQREAERHESSLSPVPSSWLTRIKNSYGELFGKVASAIEDFYKNNIKKLFEQLDDPKYAHLNLEIAASKEKLKGIFQQKKLTGFTLSEIYSELKKLNAWLEAPNSVAVLREDAPVLHHAACASSFFNIEDPAAANMSPAEEKHEDTTSHDVAAAVSSPLLSFRTKKSVSFFQNENGNPAIFELPLKDPNPSPPEPKGILHVPASVIPN
ncbi:MAG: hypothetical protein K0Q74_775 [Gammaproteobacteria bacterium]|jgi:hypothetical protein|nr:hypothetical protein [Gammaproteobacteria bacterium]